MTVDYDIESKEYTITMSEEEASHIYSAIDYVSGNCRMGLSRLATIFALKKLIENINIKTNKCKMKNCIYILQGDECTLTPGEAKKCRADKRHYMSTGGNKNAGKN